MMFLFNQTVKIIISTNIPYTTVTFDDRDPPWINKKKKKNEVYKKCVKESKDRRIFDKVKCLKTELNSIIESNKQRYYSRLSKKLVDPVISMKSHWSTLKMFLNYKKIPCIQPLRPQNEYVTEFKEKAELFNSFAEQCSLINNS